jgi:hypothetical protein
MHLMLSSNDPAKREFGKMIQECTHAGDEWLQVDNPDYHDAASDAIAKDDQSIEATEQEQLPASEHTSASEEPTPPQASPVFAQFPGLKLKNGDRAYIDNYLFYVGTRQACLAAAKKLTNVIAIGPNGSTGCWKLMIRVGNNSLEFSAREYGRRAVLREVYRLTRMAEAAIRKTNGRLWYCHSRRAATGRDSLRLERSQAEHTRADPFITTTTHNGNAIHNGNG